jgi:hypothetical protein
VLQAYLQSGWFGAGLAIEGSMRRGWPMSWEIVFLDPGGEWLGEELVRSGRVLKVSGGVNERSR